MSAVFCEYGGFEMKLKSILTGSAAAVALLAASGASASGYYVGIFGGISTFEDTFDVKQNYLDSNASNTVVGWAALLRALGYSSATTLAYYTTAFTSGGAYNSITNTGGFGPYTGQVGFRVAKYSSASAERSWTDGFDSGFVVGASIGWDFGTGFRTEFEVAYRKNDIDGGASYDQSNRTFGFFTAKYTGVVTFVTGYVGFYKYMQTLNTWGTYISSLNTSATKTTTRSSSFDVSGDLVTSGDIETWSFMANLWYDFDLGDSPIRPFIGGGIGLAQVSLNYKVEGLPTTFTDAFFRSTYSANTDDWAFAYQLGAGLGYEFGNGMVLSAQYRYFATGAVQLGQNDQMELNVEAHNFLIGLNIPIGGGM